MKATEHYSEYSFLLEKTQRSIKRYAQMKFAEENFGITVDQWMVLKQLYKHPEMNQTALANATFKGMPTLTRIVDLLCAKGLARRIADSSDRRKFQVHLTDAGMAKVKQMIPKVNLIRKAAWEGLDTTDFKDFQRILLKIQENLKL